MRHLVIAQRKKAPTFSAFHWSPHGCLIIIGQHFVTTRLVHLPKRTKTSLITESDHSRANHQILQQCAVRTAWSESDQAVRAVHSCKSWIVMKIFPLRMSLRNLSFCKENIFLEWSFHMKFMNESSASFIYFIIMEYPRR